MSLDAIDFSDQAQLLHGTRTLLTLTGGAAFTVAAGATVNQVTPIAKPGYLIALAATIPATDVGPLLEVQMLWSDPATGIQFAKEVWFFPPALTGTTTWLYGKGPTKGAQLTVAVINHCVTNTATVQLAVMETTQHIARDDWRQDICTSYPVTASATVYPTNDPLCSILGAVTGFNLGNGVTKQYVLPLYSGLINIDIGNSNSMNLSLTLAAQTPIGQVANIFQTSTTNNAPLPWTVPMPRAHCILQVVNNGAAATSLGLGLSILEYAS